MVMPLQLMGRVRQRLGFGRGEAATHPARIGGVGADRAPGGLEIEMALRAVDADERMALEDDVAHVRHHHLVVMPGARLQVFEIDRIAPRMHRARERAGLEHPRDVDAAALEITPDAKPGPADEHHHVAAIAGAAQRLDEHPHLVDAEADRGAEHEPARVGR